MKAQLLWVQKPVTSNGGYANAQEVTKGLFITKDGVTIKLDGDDVANLYNMVRPCTAPAIEKD